MSNLPTNEPTTDNIPEKWDDMALSDGILRGIYAYGFEHPSEIQRRSIPQVMSGRDVIAQAQSGMGKTGAFSIGTLSRIDCSVDKIQAIIMAPTHELVKQISMVVEALGSKMDVPVRVKTIVGGTSIQEDAKSIQETVPHIVVGSAGRVYDMIRRKYLNLREARIMVLDEADEMLSQGFKDQIYNICQALNKDAQIAVFSATMPDTMLDMTKRFMRDPVHISIPVEQLNLECIKQYYVGLRNDYMKYETLKDLFSVISISQCIIYCNSVRRVSDLHKAMSEEGFAVGCIHSSMDKAEREREFAAFRSGKYRVLISSNVTARGIDIQQVSVVINFDIPKCVHTYLHRIGRSGRWGRKGMAINFVTQHDIYLMRRIEAHYHISIEELPANFEPVP
jgi:translation initiation factor 4A